MRTSKDMRELLDKLPFEIEARVPIQLGRESISSSVVAVSELVKNSYDADAEKVEVRFHNLSEEGTSADGKLNRKDTLLTIADDGVGMSQELIKDYWLRIGTGCKAGNSRSAGGRVLTGAKGLGRLGIDRLCEKLILKTKQAGMNHILELHVDWSKYEKTNKPLSEIRHDIYSARLDSCEHLSTPESSGTYLVMQGLKDEWSPEFLDDLKKELSLLVSPFGGVNDFKIHYVTGHKALDGLLSGSRMLDAADWVVRAELSAKKKMTVTVESFRYGESYVEKERAWDDWIKGFGSVPPCGPFAFEMYFIPRDLAYLKQLNFKGQERKEFMDANQGIRIYRDYFRVRPYGEPSGKGDWLDLGLRRSKRPEAITQKGWNVGPHQVVGAVFISRERNPNLVDQTNREGIVEGKGFFALRAAILKIINGFEEIAHKKAVELNQQKPSEKAKDDADAARIIARERAQRLKAHITKAASSSSENDKHVLDELKLVVDEVATSIEEVASKTEEVDRIYADETRELENDKDTLANLASLGILTVCFGHEAKEYSNLAAANAAKLKKNYEDGHLPLMPPYDGRFEKSIEIILESTNFVRNFAGFALGNVRADKRKKKKIDLGEVIKSVFSAMSSSLERQNIAVDLSGVASVPMIRAFRIDWESIVVNLLTNSVTAMVDTPASGRKVSVTLSEDKGQLSIGFADSGCGLESGTEEYIFDAMFSTKRDLKGNVEGTGMGLAIVKNFIQEHSGGTITAKSSGRLGGAEFSILVPIC